MKNYFYLTMLLSLFFSCSQNDELEMMAQDETATETRGLFTQNVVIHKK